jgi:ribosomal protein L37AE/L43A
MSEKKHLIELRPSAVDTMIEGVYSPGHTCPYCKGEGFVKRANGEDAMCMKCGGTGELDAMVTIEWLPGQRGGAYGR